EAEQVEAEQVEAEQVEAEQVEAEQVEAEQVEAEQVEAEQVEAEQVEAEQAEAEQAEAEQAEAEQAESLRPAVSGDATVLPSVELPGAASTGDAGSATQVTELVEVFLDECQELLESCDDAMARWEKSPDDLEPVGEIKRDLHTLKGSARMAGVSEIGNLSHAMETLLGDITGGGVQGGSDLFPVIHSAFDKINELADEVRSGRALSPIEPVVALLEKVRAGGKPEEEDFRRLDADAGKPEAKPRAEAPPALKEIKGELDLPGVEAEPQPEAAPRLQEAIKISAELLDRLVDNVGEVNVFHSRVEQQVGSFDFNLKELDQTIRRVTEQLRRLELEAEAQILHRNKGMPPNPDDSVVGRQFDPLELDRYSKLQQLSRSLAESTSDLKNIHQLLADEVTGLDKILQQQARVSNELQEGLMRTRMSRFKVMAPRLRRVVRRTAMDLGKEVDLTIEGDNAELDRKMLESIVVPLEHLLRNAIAHGIESPERREALGKPREGKILVSIRREGPQIVVSVKDDGAGVDREKVIARALENGLISEGETLSPGEINKLILRPGFSTADEVSQVAGRGVGMDVVMTQLKQLNGVLEIDSEPGKGSEFRISIPFTLAINMALLIIANKGRYAVPMGAIDGVLQIPGKSLAEKMASPSATISYAGAEYRLHSLPSVLEKIAPPALNESHVYPVLLGRSGTRRVAFIADEILGNREIVVKPVGSLLGALESISGATILGDGQIVLILDIAGLVRQTLTDKAYVEEPVQEEEEKPTLVMVVDDSITIRKVTSRMLERNNFAVVTAKDGLDAIAQLQEVRPDIMLLDIEMPRMDGFELAEHIRGSEDNPDLPIIMISSRTGKKHRDKAAQLGVDRFLGKPYQDQELLENINALLKGEKNGSEQPVH
ncbi:MAG TPA: hybrid sensor histidine kinase/response regulator, partial [Gammaproteobacteria bacterium]|nr:hybrid sensor histidine kinase/response regulator [Gammaproteobacteria bacterium]